LNRWNEQAIFDEISAQRSAHFSKAPDAFFHAWKRGVELGRPGPVRKRPRRTCLNLAVDKWTCAPNVTFHQEDHRARHEFRRKGFFSPRG